MSFHYCNMLFGLEISQTYYSTPFLFSWVVFQIRKLYHYYFLVGSASQEALVRL